MNERMRELLGFLISMAALHDADMAKKFADELEQQLAAKEEKYADLEFVWQACEQEVAMLKAQLAEANRANAQLSHQLMRCEAEGDSVRQQLAAKDALLRKTREDWDKVNDKIYASGAPLGNWIYWMIRETACNNIKAIDEELK
jgi:septal ring factor EnvC (AmiA/AmiB activator)